MKKIIIFLIILIWFDGRAQNFNFKDYLLLGVDQAEKLATGYVEPLSEGLLYGLTGGWYNTAQVKNKWELELSLVTNGSFVPKDKLFREYNVGEFENLSLANGGNVIKIPTILGSNDSRVGLIATLDGQEFEFDAPTGIGLLSTNLLPNAMLQASIGLPGNSELGFRYVPKMNINGANIGVTGISIKHELTESIRNWQKWPVSISAFAAFTRLDIRYDFQTDGFLTGQSQRLESYLNSFSAEILASTKHPVWNTYGAIGFVKGKANYDLKGIYTIETQSRTISYQDPFNIKNEISGFKINIGGKVNIKRFSINLDYTFQGYNNLSLRLNYIVLTGNSNN
ncbi:DUF6588 family protein [Maribacter sp. 1_MG-2023]|uniref:DUF6588 family protein n=1 Tax=Maribacter sp. 1_MG-2023 TaxID=3062677 RepID=UPI0026E43A24|nr:DUF6588 family protein [Maribacter sp. 1_MG-2023]MDO6472641.1 hypothetical protein [Maribacter sp. 1_MG-2023]